MDFDGGMLPVEEAGRAPAPSRTSRNGRPPVGHVVDGTAPIARSGSAPASFVERALLSTLIISLPLAERFPILDRFSFPKLLLIVATFHLVVNRPWALRAVWKDPVFVAAYALVYVGIAIESAHITPRFDDIVRIAQMILGGVVIAAMCRDERALKTAIVSYLIGSVCLSILIFLTSYTTLGKAAVTDFAAASQVRQEAFEENPLQANLNTMSFGAAQGTVLALVCFLYAVGSPRRILYLALCGLCLTAAFLPESRSGIIIAVISSAAVVAAFRGRNKTITVSIILLALIGAVIYVVPDAVYARFSFTTDTTNGKQEARARVYTAAVENIPQYITFGVGAGNFWANWGKTHDFGHHGGTLGAHNIFFQVAIYWGAVGLFVVLLVVRNCYRIVPHPVDFLSLSLRGLSVSLLLYMFVMHQLYSKEFSLFLGLLVAAHHWVWPPNRSFAPRREIRS